MPFYVGVGKDDNGWYWRARNKNNRNQAWKDVIVTCGDYRIDILLDEVSSEEAWEKEIEFIALYGIENLTNITLGGKGHYGFVKSVESIEKLRKKLVGRKLTPEHIENSKNGLKRYRELYGTSPLSEETRKKISIANTGYKHTEETKLKMSKSKKGIKKSEEFIKNLSAIWKGKKRSAQNCENISKGKLAKNLKFSDETKKKLRDAWVRRKEKKIASMVAKA